MIPDPTPERVLREVAGELYAGDFDAMLVDLRRRLGGLPVLAKLFAKIERDIEAIEALRAQSAST